jgi:hypothetical protein
MGTARGWSVSRRSCLAWVAACAAPARAANDLCDPLLPRPADTPHGYRMRGTRCEGIFVREVAGDELRIAGLVQWMTDFDPARDGALTLRWASAPGDGHLQIRAHGLGRRNFYRMDTRRPMGSGRYDWPLDLMAARGLRRADIGLLARTRHDDDELLVPLQCGPRPAEAVATRHVLTAVPQVELSRLGLRWWHADERPAAAAEPAPGYYPAERPVELALQPARPGIHHCELSAVLRHGGSAALAFRFHHPGR